jgi:hypothetical protein
MEQYHNPIRVGLMEEMVDVQLEVYLHLEEQETMEEQEALEEQVTEVQELVAHLLSSAKEHLQAEI